MTAQQSLFPPEPRREFAPGAVLLAAFAAPLAPALLQAIEAVAAAAPFRHQETPGGRRMSVAMTNCGALGWVSDARGYRYEARDPQNDRPWPPMPAVFDDLAKRAAAAAGHADFAPDACLVNRYVPGARMTLHQDVDERDFAQPIVSISLGLPATFRFGGLSRTDPTLRLRLEHGDAVVWGGPSRRCFHGIDTVREGEHALLGRVRFNLTFRVAG